MNQEEEETKAENNSFNFGRQISPNEEAKYKLNIALSFNFKYIQYEERGEKDRISANESRLICKQ